MARNGPAGITATRDGRGSPTATVQCAECGRIEVLSANIQCRNEGMARRKMAHKGWTTVKGTIRCPDCEAKRRSKRMKPTPRTDTQQMPADKTLREPSPKQIREIMSMLEIAYDDTRQRYKPGESDKTVAEALGPDVLWGWVAREREKYFGPDPRSSEIDGLMGELKKLQAEQVDLRTRLNAAEGMTKMLLEKAAAIS